MKMLGYVAVGLGTAMFKDKHPKTLGRLRAAIRRRNVLDFV